MDFEILIAGTDANAYYMARCYHEAYNKKATLLGKTPMIYTKYTNILNCAHGHSSFFYKKNDFSYEFDLAHMNQNLNPEIETLFLPTKAQYAIVKSSSIKELAMFGGDISRMVPKIVEEALKAKYPVVWEENKK